MKECWIAKPVREWEREEAGEEAAMAAEAQAERSRSGRGA